MAVSFTCKRVCHKKQNTCNWHTTHRRTSGFNRTVLLSHAVPLVCPLGSVIRIENVAQMTVALGLGGEFKLNIPKIAGPNERG